jgi:hypothetical protein
LFDARRTLLRYDEHQTSEPRSGAGMSEPATRPRTEAPDENQARRAERGIIAAYIHELSQRHEEEESAEPMADGIVRTDA